MNRSAKIEHDAWEILVDRFIAQCRELGISPADAVLVAGTNRQILLEHYELPDLTPNISIVVKKSPAWNFLNTLQSIVVRSSDEV